MKALIKLLDFLHAPLIFIGACVAIMTGMLVVGLLYILFCCVLLEFLSHVLGLDNSEALWFTIYGAPIFAGFMGIVWLFIRRFLITDRLVDYLDKAEDSTEDCLKIKAGAVKSALPAKAEAAPSMIINKIKDKV